MKNILICVTLSIICLSCEKKINDENNNTTLQNVALKLFFTNIEDESPYKIQKYNYDSEHRLETIIHYPGDTLEQALIREFYEYSPNDVLINRYGYHYVDDSIGWQLNDSTHYQYENNNLHVEEIYFSSSWTTPAIKLIYKYLGSTLIAVSKYLDLQFESYTTYHYSENNCIEERTYSDSLKVNLSSYSLHMYEDELRLRSEFFTAVNNKFQIISYSYNNYGNLIIEDSHGTDFPIVKPVDYYYRYEY